MVLSHSMDVRQIVGHNVRNYRLAAKLSQTEVAQRIGSRSLGVSQGYVSELEAGRRNPTISTLQQIAHALGIKTSALLEESTVGEGNGGSLS